MPILGTGTTSAPDTAALVNGTFGHALDFDDVLSMMPAHPSAVILAALIASLGSGAVTGRALIEAYVIGIEVGGKIGLGMTVGHYHRGYHATGSLALFPRWQRCSSCIASTCRCQGRRSGSRRRWRAVCGGISAR